MAKVELRVRLPKPKGHRVLRPFGVVCLIRFRLIHLYRAARPPVKKGMGPDLIWATFQRLASGRQRGVQVTDRGKVLVSQIDIGERPEPFGGLQFR